MQTIELINDTYDELRREMGPVYRSKMEGYGVLVSRLNTLLAYVKDTKKEIGKFGEIVKHTAPEAYRHKLHELEALVPRWISVEDRRPEANDDVLVFVQHPISGHCWTQIAHRLSAMALDESDEYDEWWLDGSGETVRYITHWMPLPEPPEVNKP